MKILIKNPFKRKQKGTIVKLWIVCALCLLAVHSGCNKHVEKASDEDCECFPSVELTSMDDAKMMRDCLVSTFMEGISMYSNCCDVYIIRGLALDTYEYGRHFKLLEDLKGNFPKNMNTFIVWGDGFDKLETNRMDDMRLYGDQDVLIMLLTPTRESLSMLLPQESRFEKPEDFTTIPCTCSVLKLSDGYVTGCLTPEEGFNYVEQTMQWSDFQKVLHKILNIK